MIDRMEYPDGSGFTLLTQAWLLPQLDLREIHGPLCLHADFPNVYLREHTSVSYPSGKSPYGCVQQWHKGQSVFEYSFVISFTAQSRNVITLYQAGKISWILYYVALLMPDSFKKFIYRTWPWKPLAMFTIREVLADRIVQIRCSLVLYRMLRKSEAVGELCDFTKYGKM
jgi:hypothetical protein